MPPIHALPRPTTQQLTSTQLLSSPVSAIKELIDNALDARASSIFIEISPNALDILQVRDNGIGIPPIDRPLVARRHCTSKITTLDELRRLAGRSLGFRGEALASLAECSGALTIVTRVEGEQVAVRLKIKRDGELDGQENVSHPIGTTVRIIDFFSTFPVRRQDAQKRSAKHLAQIRRILCAYAFSRPTVRFSLKVLKAKTERGDMAYAPKPGAATVQDVAFKIVGKGCASYCRWTTFESKGFEIEAFLPRVDAAASHVGGHGQYLSVDRRPMSAAGGVMKNIVSKFKERVRGSGTTLSGVKDPFLYLDLKCPPDSYDVNVEPAKDDVVFEDSEVVLGVIDEFLNLIYPIKDDLVEISEDVQEFNKTNHQLPNGKGTYFTIYEDNDNCLEPEATCSAQLRMKQKGGDPDSQNDPKGRVHHLERRPDEENEYLDMLSGTCMSNPWTIAKMNTPVKDPSKSTKVIVRPPLTPIRIDLAKHGSGSSSDSPSFFDPQSVQFSPLALHSSSPTYNKTQIGSQPALQTSPLGLGIPRKTPVQVHDGRLENATPSPSFTPINFQQISPSSVGGSQNFSTQIQTQPKLLQKVQNINKPFVSPVRRQGSSVNLNASSVTNLPRSTRQGRKKAQQQISSSPSHSVDPLSDRMIVTSEPPPRNRDIREFIGQRQNRPIGLCENQMVDGPISASKCNVAIASSNPPSLVNFPTADNMDRYPSRSPPTPSTGIAIRRSNNSNSNNNYNIRLDSLPRVQKKDLTTILEELHDQLGSPDYDDETARFCALPSPAPSPQRPSSSSSKATFGATQNDNDNNSCQVRGSMATPLSLHERSVKGGVRAQGRRRASSPVGLQRTRSSLLPLERVPVGRQTHNLVLPIQTSIATICTLFEKAGDTIEDRLLWKNHTMAGDTTTFANLVEEEGESSNRTSGRVMVHEEVMQMWSEKLVSLLGKKIDNSSTTGGGTQREQQDEETLRNGLFEGIKNAFP